MLALAILDILFVSSANYNTEGAICKVWCSQCSYFIDAFVPLTLMSEIVVRFVGAGHDVSLQHPGGVHVVARTGVLPLPVSRHLCVNSSLRVFVIITIVAWGVCLITLRFKLHIKLNNLE